MVGITGGGKSTIAYLIARFYDPECGIIKLDGKDLTDLKINSIRKNIGLVKQEVTLFHASIRENISYGKSGATDKEIIKAAKLAGIHNFIMSLPEKYKTDIGEEGMQLSGGQRQRVSIARVILKNPQIVIFDEATSSLDPKTEEKLHKSLKQFLKNKTTLIIAHKLESVKNADKIIILDRHGINEQGTFKELLKKKGRFYKLYKKQLE